MFIYEFMGGIVQTITGEDDEDADEGSYDPHMHRKVTKPTSYADTMIHLLKGSIGAGILAMPDAMSRVGVVVGFTGMTIVGIIATYCIHLLIGAQYELCKRHRVGYMSYAKSMQVALESGPRCLKGFARCSSCFVDSVLVIWQLGLCCVYIVFVASNIKQVMDYHKLVFAVRLHICFLLLPLLLANIVMDLKLLTPLSTISNGLTIMGLLLATFYLIEDDIIMDDTKFLPFKNPEALYTMLAGLPVFVGMTLFALEAVGVVLALEYNMEKPKQFSGCFGLFNLGMTVIVGLYLLVGVFGFLKYGSDIKASLTLNLPEDQKKAQTAKLVFALAIFLTYPLQNFVAYQIIIHHLKSKLSRNKHKVADYVLRILLIFTSWSVALAIPQLGPFISLFGALCLSMLALIFPALLDSCTRYQSGYGPCKYRLVKNVMIAILGMICLVSGCYTSILEIITESSH